MRNNYIKLDKELFLPTYNRLPIVVDYAFGTRIFDINGNAYLDFLGGIAVNILGHSHPKILNAIDNQIRKYMHLSNYFYQITQIDLAKKLIDISGYDKVFFSNSGTEAIEGALKLARRWGNLNSKNEIIAFSGGFHGRTYGALSLMDKTKYKDKMGPFLDGIKILEYNNQQELENTINDKTTAVFIEFVQGEGGLKVADKNFIDKLFKLKNKFKFLIIADEIQSGIGRTGKFFAFEHYGVKPDIVTLAKGLGGGLPLGAILTTNELSDVFETGMHGTTFGGNSVACAAGLVVLDELEKGLQNYVVSISKYFDEKLHYLKEKFSIIEEVRGIGLMKGLVFKCNASEIVDKLIKQGIISNATSKNVLRLVPPYIIQQYEIELFIEKLELILADY